MAGGGAMLAGIDQIISKATKIPVEIVPYHIYMPDVSGEYCTIITLFLFFLFSAVVGSSYSQRWNEVLILFLKKQGEEAARLTFEVISKGGSAIRHYRNFIE
ncbi:MAG: hypothetical protein IIA45_11155 [Bacteroidetes bacterium]|nr:hypothetical protein [Bacteroidota bacterium]